MRTKKLLIVVTALIACLAIGSATVATAKPKNKNVKVKISLSVSITPPGPYAPYSPGSFTFSGRVKAKGPSACRKGRTVTISRGGPVVGTAVTNPNGNFVLGPLPGVPPSGTYTASLPELVVKKGKKQKKQFTCKAAVSNAVVI
jgi:hypothetical protein